MDKPILMIHDFKKEYLDLPLEDYILTFDDGLVSPLEFWRHINALDTEKIFFIPTGAVDGGSIEGKDPKEFMNLRDLIFLDGHMDVTLGGHSHSHMKLDGIVSLQEQIHHMTADTITMCQWFRRNLGYYPTHFCFPYNSGNDVYKSILRLNFKIPFLYGENRLDIEELL
jgi:peptidoglycan/xylan/chitin deacetylase (PgdA/CDA1 family)